jgi:DNA-binding NarL/FixJ family response regulator
MSIISTEGHVDIADYRSRLPKNLDQEVELETVTHRGERRVRRFPNVAAMMSTIAIENDALTCAHGYDVDTDTDKFTNDEMNACTFASAIDDYASWSAASVRTLDNLTDATSARTRAEESWRLAIADAKDAGFSLRTIAEAAGISHQTVVNVLRNVDLGIFD